MAVRQSSRSREGQLLVTAGVLYSMLSLLPVRHAAEPPDVDNARFTVLRETRESAGLLTVPQDFSPLVTSVYLSSNDITHLPDLVFSNYTSLRQVVLDFNSVTHISTAAFAGTPVVYLALVRKGFSGDMPDFCAVNSTLEFLNLRGNKLTGVPDHRLSCLGILLQLEVTGNSLTQMLNTHALNPGIAHIYTGNNPLNISTPMSLATLYNLQHLHLGDLDLTAFPDLSELPNPAIFERLYLDGNPITEVTAEALSALNATSLTFLQISATTELLATLAPSLSKLETRLNVRRTSGILSLTLPFLPALQTLHVYETTITSFPDVRALNGSLQNLHVTDNSDLAAGRPEVLTMLTGMDALTNLYLTDNALTSLPNVSSLLPALDVMEIGGNPWACDCHLAWMWADPGTQVITDMAAATCAEPPMFDGAQLTALSAAILPCSSGGKSSQCATVGHTTYEEPFLAYLKTPATSGGGFIAAVYNTTTSELECARSARERCYPAFSYNARNTSCCLHPTPVPVTDLNHPDWTFYQLK